VDADVLICAVLASVDAVFISFASASLVATAVQLIIKQSINQKLFVRFFFLFAFVFFRIVYLIRSHSANDLRKVVKSASGLLAVKRFHL